MGNMSTAVVIALITTGGVVFTALFKLVEWRYKYYLDKKISKSIKMIEKDVLLEHQLFSRIKYWIERKINHLEFGDSERNYIYRNIATVVFVTFSEKTQDFIKNHTSLDSMSKNEFTNQVFILITDIISTYNQGIRGNFDSKFVEGIAIYEKTMNDHEKGFNKRNEQTVQFIERMVKEVCESDIYCNNTEKFEIILDTFQAGLGVTYPSLENTYRGMNGCLSELFKYGKK